MWEKASRVHLDNTWARHGLRLRWISMAKRHRALVERTCVRWRLLASRLCPSSRVELQEIFRPSIVSSLLVYIIVLDRASLFTLYTRAVPHHVALSAFRHVHTLHIQWPSCGAEAHSFSIHFSATLAEQKTSLTKYRSLYWS